MMANAIAKGMKNVQVTFDLLDNITQPPDEYQSVRCQVIFDMKIEDFYQMLPCHRCIHDGFATYHNICQFSMLDLRWLQKTA